MRSAVYDVQTHIQIARIEAISRNRPCRFVVDTGTRVVQVFDSMGTSGSTADDELLFSETLPSAVSFARPDSGAAVTLPTIGGNAHQAIFSSDGTVSSGSGDLNLFGGDQYRQISLFLAGGLMVRQWDGSYWVAGS